MAFRSEWDLWGCSFSIVIMISVLSGMSRGARFVSFSKLSVLSGIVGYSKYEDICVAIR